MTENNQKTTEHDTSDTERVDLAHFNVSESEHIEVNVYDNEDGTPKDKYLSSSTGGFSLVLDQSNEGTDSNGGQTGE